MENQILELASSIQRNIRSEADAVIEYTAVIQFILSADIDESVKETTIESLNEIISDELNHQKKLQEIYSSLVGVEPNKD